MEKSKLTKQVLEEVIELIIRLEKQAEEEYNNQSEDYESDRHKKNSLFSEMIGMRKIGSVFVAKKHLLK